MKKVISITLGGVVFAIEQDAYDALAQYFEAIRQQLSSNTDHTEIVADIENAIAEKCIARKRSEKRAVTTEDVALIMQEMGSPFDFDDHSIATGATGADTLSPAPTQKKRLYRDTDDAVIAGIGAGLARYFDIDPVIVRLLFVVAAFFNGFGILAYFILWLVIPAAKTTAEKYEMRGEQVTLSRIVKQIQDNVDTHVTDSMKLKGLRGHVHNVLNKVFHVLGLIVRFFLRAVRLMCGVLLALGGVFGVVALTVMTTFLVFVVDPKISDPITTALMAHITSTTAGVIFFVSAFIAALVVPVIAIIAGVSLLTLRNRFTVRSVLALGITWVIAFSFAVVTALAMLPTFSDVMQDAKRAYDNEPPVWHTVDLAEAPENILIYGQVSVRLVEDEQVSLRILASEETYNDVNVQQNGHRLAIDRHTHFRLCFFCNVYKPYAIELRAPNVEALHMRGNGNVFLEGISGAAFDLRLSGAFEAAAEGLNVAQLTLRASGSNDVALTGTSTRATLTLNGSSEVHMLSLATEQVSVDASGAHAAYVAPTAQLTGSLKGGNTVQYADNETLQVDISQHPPHANEVEILSEAAAGISMSIQTALSKKIQEQFTDW